MSRMHGNLDNSRTQWLETAGWDKHAPKELRRRRRANKVAKQARKRNRGK